MHLTLFFSSIMEVAALCKGRVVTVSHLLAPGRKLGVCVWNGRLYSWGIISKMNPRFFTASYWSAEQQRRLVRDCRREVS